MLRGVAGYYTCIYMIIVARRRACCLIDVMRMLWHGYGPLVFGM